MASVNYKVAGFSPNVKSDLGVIQRNDFRRDGAYSKDGVTPSRFSYNFDGVDDYAVLANRAINPDGDIDIEWYQRGGNSTGTRTIVAQCDSATAASREFVLRFLNGFLEMSVGGTTIFGVGSGIAFLDGTYRVILVGPSLTVYFNGSVVLTVGGRTRGASREPAAPTRIGVRNSGGSLVEFYQGIIYNIRINGVLWQMATRNSATQVSTPAGNTMTLVNTTSDRWQEIIE